MRAVQRAPLPAMAVVRKYSSLFSRIEMRRRNEPTMPEKMSDNMACYRSPLEQPSLEQPSLEQPSLKQPSKRPSILPYGETTEQPRWKH
jgi:hypothetical protein